MGSEMCIRDRICADIKWAAVDALNGKLELGGGDDLALGGGIIDRRPD